MSDQKLLENYDNVDSNFFLLRQFNVGIEQAGFNFINKR